LNKPTKAENAGEGRTPTRLAVAVWLAPPTGKPGVRLQFALMVLLRSYSVMA
jgi:hypothetical protein